jgi:predicted secreted protein
MAGILIVAILLYVCLGLQIEQLQEEIRDLEGAQEETWRSETASLMQETQALHKDKSALLQQVNTTYETGTRKWSDDA